MDRQGKKLVQTNVKDNDFAYLLKLVEPYKHSLSVQHPSEGGSVVAHPAVR